MPKIGVVLSGCGVYDGTEIHEAVITLLALDQAGVESVIMAPNIGQLHVVNHLSGEEMQMENRNVLVESARIARGNIRDIALVNITDLDALIFPGGFGVAKNLSDFAMVGADCEINPDILRLTSEIIEANKPIGAICIAPAFLAKILELMGKSANLTIGNDESTAKNIVQMGSKHTVCNAGDILVDETNKIVSTPAYMVGQRISEVAIGIEKLVVKLISMV